MELYVVDETSKLEAVILGIGDDRGIPRGINPMMRKHMREGTFPTDQAVEYEIGTLEDTLSKHGVEVLRPQNLSTVEQIFARDIGFVINQYFFVSNMKHEVRSSEIKGIQHILDQIDPDHIIAVPDGIVVEGGDVILWDDYVFVGLGDRTSRSAVDFLSEMLPNKNVIGIDIQVDQRSADKNILHLDCAFQPIGTKEAIIYMDGFVDHPGPILDLFPRDQRIEVSLEEKNRMFPNIFSISPDEVILEHGFERLKSEMQDRDYKVTEVNYSETSKLGGLLRCSTLPLRRSR